MKTAFDIISALIICAVGIVHRADGDAETTSLLITNVSTFYDCTNGVDADGFCGNTTAQTVLPPLNETALTETTLLEFTFLQPRTGPRCWDTAVMQCCLSPCRQDTCKNKGICVPLNDTNKPFRCDCSDTHTGEWCQESKNCDCSPNANCGSTGNCTCKDGYEGDGKTCTAICERLNFTRKNLHAECGYDAIIFEKSFGDIMQESNEKCGDRSLAKIRCPDDASGFDVTSFHCVPCNKSLESVLDDKTPVEAEDVESTINDLTVLTTESNKSADSVEKTTKLLNQMAEALDGNKDGSGTSEDKKLISKETMQNVLEVVENLQKELVIESQEKPTGTDLEKQPTQSTQTAKKRDATRDAAEIIDKFARAVNLSATANKTVTISTEKMSLMITEPDTTSDSVQGIMFEPTSYVPTNASETPKKKKTLTMTIPSNTLKKMQALLDRSGGGTMRLVFVLHQDASLLTVDKRTGQVVQATFKEGESKEKTSLEGLKFSVDYYSQPQPSPEQELVVKDTNYELNITYFCVFWDYVAEDWATEGCEYFPNPGGSPYCECSHFTSFALLMRVTKLLKDYKAEYYSLITCGLSVLGLVVTILIYVLVKDLRVRRPTPIMVNICVNLAIGFLMFIVGMDGRAREYSDIGCYVSAVIMHIAFLCAWFWMMIYSLNMYYALVKVVGTSPLVAKKVFMYLVGYGSPILIVVIDLIVSTQLDKAPASIDDKDFESEYIASHICWVRHMSMYIGFLTPIGVILFINIILFFLIIRKLTWKKREIQSSKEAASITQQLSMAVTMITMMGLTWIFGYIMLISTDPTYQHVMSVIFDVFNACQGVVIFLVSCVRQKAVRDLWVGPIKARLCCGKHKKSKGVKELQSSSGYTANFTNLQKVLVLWGNDMPIKAQEI